MPEPWRQADKVSSHYVRNNNSPIDVKNIPLVPIWG